MYMGHALKSFSARSIAASASPSTTTSKVIGPPVKIVPTTTVQALPPTKPATSPPPVTSHPTQTTPPSTTTTTTTTKTTTTTTITPTTPPLDGGFAGLPTISVGLGITPVIPVNSVQHGAPPGDTSKTSLSIPPQVMDAAGGMPLKTDDSISTPTPIGTTPLKAHGIHTHTTPVVVALDDGTTILSVTKTMAASSNITPTSGGSGGATSGGFSAWIIAAIIGGGACLAAMTIGVIMYRKWRRKQQSRFERLLDPPSETVHSILQMSSSGEQPSPSLAVSPHHTLSTILEEEEGVAHLRTVKEWSLRTSHRRTLSVGSEEAAPPSYHS